MATLLVHIQVTPGHEAEFEDVVRELGEKTWPEPGNRVYEYFRGAEPGLYYCLLSFDDFHAFLAHQTSDHHESASPKLGALVSDLKLEWVDPVNGASTLVPTEMQPVPDGANELTKTYHQVFAAKVQEWWQALRSR